MFDYSKLKGKIKEVFDTQDAFSEAMEMHRVSMNQRLSGIIEWRSPEIKKACDLLGIPLEEAHLYFFAPKVVISQHEEN